MDYLKDMNLFVEVARAKSFRRAALRLQIPSSTLSRRIAKLERNIGLLLFHRTTRRMELTEAGQYYYENCRRIIEEAQLAHQSLLDLQNNPSGVIRASLPIDFSIMYLSPILQKFSRLYPAIRFELDLTPTQVDLISEGIDIVIRMGAPQEANLIARKIASFTMGLLASPEYLETYGYPKHPQDLLQYQCLRVRDAPWLLTHTKGYIESVSAQGRFLANNVGMLRQLAICGEGIMAGSLQMEQAEMVAGRLVRVLPEWHLPLADAYALTTTRLLPTKVRLLIEFLAAELKTEAGLAASL